MHHVVLETWSRRASFLHRREARAKLIGLLLVLIWMGTSKSEPFRFTLGYAALLAFGILLSGLPVVPLLARASLVLPFAATFSAISFVAGDTARAQLLLVKSSFSALAVVLVVATTPMPVLLESFRRLGAPRMLVLVTQFLYRYLFVVVETAQHMRLAALSRGGFRWNAAGGAVAVLFGSAYSRAEGIHQAMIARGFNGSMPGANCAPVRWLDVATLSALTAALLAARFLWSL